MVQTQVLVLPDACEKKGRLQEQLATSVGLSTYSVRDALTMAIRLRTEQRCGPIVPVLTLLSKHYPAVYAPDWLPPLTRTSAIRDYGHRG